MPLPPLLSSHKKSWDSSSSSILNNIHFIIALLILLFTPCSIFASPLPWAAADSQKNAAVSAVYDITQAPYNADGTDSLDDSTALEDAIHDAISANIGAIIRIPAGTYYLDTYIPPTITTDLHIQGDGQGVTILSGVNRSLSSQAKMFPIQSPSFELSNLTILDWKNRQIVFPRPGAQSISIHDCTFERVGGQSNSYMSVLDTESTSGINLSLVRIYNNVVRGGSGAAEGGGLVRIGKNTSAEKVFIHNNTISDIKTSAITIGFSTPGVTVREIQVTNNIIDGVNTETRDDPKGIMVQGFDVKIADNSVRKVTCNAGCSDIEGIYTKALYGIITRNFVEDASGEIGSDGAITVKGKNRGESDQLGYGIIVSNNHIRRTSAVEDGKHIGIYIKTSESTVQGNWIENFNSGIQLAIGGSDYHSIIGNQIHNTTYGLDKGFSILAFVDGTEGVIIKDNIIGPGNAYGGINVRYTSGTGEANQVIVSGNMINGGTFGEAASGPNGNEYSGIRIRSTNPLNHLIITDNSIRNTRIGLDFSFADADVSDVWSFRNHFQDVHDYYKNESNVTNFHQSTPAGNANFGTP